MEDVRFLLPNAQGGGSGVIGALPVEMNARTFLQSVKKEFGVECLMHNELLRRPIRTVALCGGAGDFLLQEAVNQQADAFLTGEMHYHTYMGMEQTIQIAVAGHYQTEQYTKDLIAKTLREQCEGLHIVISQENTNPICYMCE